MLLASCSQRLELGRRVHPTRLVRSAACEQQPAVCWPGLSCPGPCCCLRQLKSHLTATKAVSLYSLAARISQRLPTRKEADAPHSNVVVFSQALQLLVLLRQLGLQALQLPLLLCSALLRLLHRPAGRPGRSRSPRSGGMACNSLASCCCFSAMLCLLGSLQVWQIEQRLAARVKAQRLLAERQQPIRQQPIRWPVY